MSGHEIHRKEILKYLAEGYRLRAIAKKLNANYRTVEKWIDKLQEELHAETLPALVAKAIRKKIIQ